MTIYSCNLYLICILINKCIILKRCLSLKVNLNYQGKRDKDALNQKNGEKELRNTILIVVCLCSGTKMVLLKLTDIKCLKNTGVGANVLTNFPSKKRFKCTTASGRRVVEIYKETF